MYNLEQVLNAANRTYEWAVGTEHDGDSTKPLRRDGVLYSIIVDALRSYDDTSELSLDETRYRDILLNALSSVVMFKSFESEDQCKFFTRIDYLAENRSGCYLSAKEHSQINYYKVTALVRSVCLDRLIIEIGGQELLDKVLDKSIELGGFRGRVQRGEFGCPFQR